MKEERDGDYMVALSKTAEARHMRVAGEMAKVRAAMLEAFGIMAILDKLAIWMGRIRRAMDK